MRIEDELRQRVSRRIIGLRIERSTTVQQLADLTGLSERQINRLEKGGTDFRSRALCRLARAFQVDPEYFVIRDAHLAQAMRDPEFAANSVAVAQRYFQQKAMPA